MRTRRFYLVLLAIVLLASCGQVPHPAHKGPTLKHLVGLAHKHTFSPIPPSPLRPTQATDPATTPQNGGVSAALKWVEQRSRGWNTGPIRPIAVPDGELLLGTLPWTDIYVNTANGKWVSLPLPWGSISFERETSNGSLLFLVQGPLDDGNYMPFPFQVLCVPQPDGTFPAGATQQIPKYYPVSTSASFGNDRKEVLTSVYATSDGLQLVFGPQPGDNGSFFADFANVPETQTSCDGANNELVFNFANTEIGQVNDLSTLQNEYVQSVSADQTATGTEVRVHLANGVGFYNGEITNDQTTQLPHLHIKLAKTAPEAP